MSGDALKLSPCRWCETLFDTKNWLNKAGSGRRRDGDGEGDAALELRVVIGAALALKPGGRKVG